MIVRVFYISFIETRILAIAAVIDCISVRKMKWSITAAMANLLEEISARRCIGGCSIVRRFGLGG